MLQNGKRTKASIESTVSTFGNFDGTWTFDPADPKTQVNIVNLEHMEANGTYAVRQAQQTGSVRFSSGLGDTIRAHTDNGCTWTLESHGNTAELMPAAQSCTTSAGTTKLTFFAVASNGQHQIAIMAGINAQGDMFQMIISSLSK
jgi:hypothetical protein